MHECLNIPPICKGIKKQNKKHVSYMLVDQEINHIMNQSRDICPSLAKTKCSIICWSKQLVNRDNGTM
jgi:hypothetical protein